MENRRKKAIKIGKGFKRSLEISSTAGFLHATVSIT
jgi:hypothetical protein